MKRAVHHTRRWHGRATAAEARKKKRRKKKTVPRVAIGGRHFCLLAVFPARFHGYCSHRSPVIIVLTLVWLFPSCHAITCRELACCTSRIPRTCPRPTQRRASVLIWPQKNQWIRPFFFSFLFFLSLSWYFHQLPFHLFPSVSKAIFFSLSLSFIFFLPVYLSIYLSIWIRWNQAFRLFVSAVSSHGWFWWTNHPTSFEHGQRLHEYASRWPRPTGVDAGWKVTCWPEIASSRGIWYPCTPARARRDERRDESARDWVWPSLWKLLRKWILLQVSALES